MSGAFRNFAWATLAYTVLVILWGAFVRATGSGAGCGSHWPLCNGEVVPRAPAVETVIELTHRATSGIALVLVVILAVWAWRRFPAGHRVRKASAWSLAFMLSEAAVGAGLVLLEYVGGDESTARAVWMGLHLVNTFLLLAALTAASAWASGLGAPAAGWWPRKARKPALVLAALLLVGVTGAITALGDTLYPGVTLEAASSAQARALLRARLVHPILAVLVTAAVLVAGQLARARADAASRRWAGWTVSLAFAQLALGAVNVLAKAPVGIQIAHLLLADAVWITALLWWLAVLAEPTSEPEPAASRTLAERAA